MTIEMKKIFILLLSILVVSASSAQPLPDFYHDYSETMDSLWALESQYPNIMQVFQMGVSQQDSLPIYAVKISDNVAVTEDEPRLLFVGQVHAEENIGIEIVLDMVTELLTLSAIAPTMYYVYSAELYFIPTLNPEGFSVVMPETTTTVMDVTYRKNKRDNIGDGIFRFQPGAGYDTSGVDLNRNFGLNWIHGNALFEIGNEEEYDYYRGPYPFSESETQALVQLCQEKHFCLGIIYHQSRTGNVSDNVIYSWNWETGKNPPDYDAIDYLGIEVANLLHPLTNPGQHYAPHGSTGMNGCTHDWLYSALGFYEYTIETSSIQPALQSDLEFIINDNKLGIIHLIKRAIGYGDDMVEKGQLTGKITDAVTGLPLAAETELVGRSNGWIQPRYSDAQFGRYRYILNHGSYTLRISKHGYQTIENIISVSENNVTQRNYTLTPLTVYSVSGTVYDVLAGTPADQAVLYFWGNTDTVITASGGSFSLQLPESQYRLRIDSDGYVSYFQDDLNIAGNTILNRDLSPADTVFSDDFENGAGNWTMAGSITWGIDYTESHSGGASLGDSPGEDYEELTAGYAQIIVDLSDQLTAMLKFWHKYYLEPEADFGLVEVSTDGGSEWNELAAYDLQNVDWREEKLNLTAFCGNTVIIRFTMETDINIQESGWNIDDVEVIASAHLSGTTTPPPLISTFRLDKPYPNPFNSQLMIKYSLADAGKAEMAVYNIMGEKVAALFSGEQPAGENRAVWNAGSASSGVYFIRLTDGENISIAKALLLK